MAELSTPIFVLSVIGGTSGVLLATLGYSALAYQAGLRIKFKPFALHIVESRSLVRKKFVASLPRKDTYSADVEGALKLIAPSFLKKLALSYTLLIASLVFMYVKEFA